MLYTLSVTGVEGFDVVEAGVNAGEGGQVPKPLERGNTIVADVELSQVNQYADPLAASDVVEREVQLTQVRQLFQVLDLLDAVSRQVERDEISVQRLGPVLAVLLLDGASRIHVVVVWQPGAQIRCDPRIQH